MAIRTKNRVAGILETPDQYFVLLRVFDLWTSDWMIQAQVQYVPQAGASHDANDFARPSAASWNQIHCWMDGGKIAGEAPWWWHVRKYEKMRSKVILQKLEVNRLLLWIFRVHPLLWYLLVLILVWWIPDTSVSGIDGSEDKFQGWARMAYCAWSERSFDTKEIWDRILPSRLGRWLCDWLVCRLEWSSRRVQFTCSWVLLTVVWLSCSWHRRLPVFSFLTRTRPMCHIFYT